MSEKTPETLDQKPLATLGIVATSKHVFVRLNGHNVLTASHTALGKATYVKDAIARSLQLLGIAFELKPIERVSIPRGEYRPRREQYIDLEPTQNLQSGAENSHLSGADAEYMPNEINFKS